VLPNKGFGAIPKSFGLQDDKATVVFENADTRITAFSVSHAPIHPAVGYQIRYKDRVMVISGDTTPSAHVQREAQGVDLLVHEAMSTELMTFLQEGAHEAKPPLPLPGLVDVFLKGTAEIFKGKIQVAKDGDMLSLPAGQKVIQTSNRF
jgi:ribonuclease Z